jgi:hypothetical protein
VEEMIKAHETLLRKPKGKIPLGRFDVDGKIILQWMLKKRSVRVWSRLIWLRIGTSDGLDRELLDQLSDYYLLQDCLLHKFS